jgi:hypothetical protein
MCIHTPKTYFGLYFFAFSESETYFEGCGQWTATQYDWMSLKLTPALKYVSTYVLWFHATSSQSKIGEMCLNCLYKSAFH